MTTKQAAVESVAPPKHESLAAALAAFQSELPTIKKGNQANAGSYSYQYADLADISPLVLPLLGKHGLAWSAQPTMVGDHFQLHYVLMHESGHSLEGVYPLPTVTVDPQKMGSAITYARRYALCAVTGVAPGGDDDDAASAPPAAARKAAQPAPQPIARPQLTEDWFVLGEACNSREELREVYRRAAQKEELGLDIPQKADGTTVHEYLVGVSNKLRESEEHQAENSAGEFSQEGGDVTGWPVAQIPGTEEGVEVDE